MSLGLRFSRRKELAHGENSSFCPGILCPLANFWSHITKHGLTGEDQELVPVSKVIEVAKDTLALIGSVFDRLQYAKTEPEC